MTVRSSKSEFQSQRGAALLAALCLAMVFALCLTSFVALAYTSLTMSTRNALSTHGIELAEAGLEDALYSVNFGDWTTSSWTSIEGGTGKTTTLSGFTFENGATGTVTLNVHNYALSNPRITSEASVTVTNGSSAITVKRMLQAYGSYVPSFTNATGAMSGKIKFKNGGLVDSYDSSLGAYGALVGSPAAANEGYSALVVSHLTTSSPSVVLGSNTVVDGYVIGTASTPESYSSGSQVIGPSSTVAVDPSRVLTESSPTQQILNENYPNTATVLNSSQTNLTGTQVVTIGSPTATVATPYYIFGNLSLSQNSVLNINGPVILLVYGNVSISQNAQIVIAGTATTAGGPRVSLEMHVPYGNMSIDGGGIANTSQSPERLMVMSTWNSSSTLEVGTTTPFYGVLDFPSNSITVNNNVALFGSVLAASLVFNNTPAIHYDMNLRTFSPLSGTFMGPVFNAFASSGSGPSAVHPMTVNNVIEIAAQ